MKTSYLVLSSVDLDQITPPNWLPLPFSDFIRRGMDQGLLTGAVFIDLRKAFDSVDHDLLNRMDLRTVNQISSKAIIYLGFPKDQF